MIGNFAIDAVIGRKQFILSFLTLVALVAVLGWLASLSGPGMVTLVSLLALFLYWSLANARARDLNRPSWYGAVSAYWFVPGYLASFLLPPETVKFVFMASMLVNIVIVLDLMISRASSRYLGRS